MWKWGDPRRMAWTLAYSSPVVGQYSMAGLYNNSNQQHILCVHDVLYYKAADQFTVWNLLQAGGTFFQFGAADASISEIVSL